MTKVDIISGFLGAGKTTLIKKLIAESFQGGKVVLIENEFGEIGIDGGFLKDAGIQITEMNSGCICCTLVGDFGKALKEVVEQYHPDRIIIEPSGVGKLSDVARAVERVEASVGLVVNSLVTVVDGIRAKMYMKNFGEFFNNQVESAGTVIISRSQNMKQDKLDELTALIRQHNEKAVIITTSWDELKGDQILGAMENGHTLVDAMMEELRNTPYEEHHHHHHHDEEEGEHHHHHHEEGEGEEGEHHCPHRHEHDEEEGEHHHHHHEEGEGEEGEHHCPHRHEHDGEEGEHHHHHHEEGEGEEGEHHCPHRHEHDGEEGEHHHHHHEEGEHHHHHEEGEHHHHHHHHGHDADEVFTSWGQETSHKFSEDQLKGIMEKLKEGEEYGIILRAKGYVPSSDGEDWLHFDLTPGEYEIRHGSADYTGRLCVIGSQVKEDKLKELFGL
ncbi:MAG: GTP-binding protein [Lachnospiraceae bacterium]|nr:GTP-binding protein [Lachnospiraceae bacterium]